MVRLQIDATPLLLRSAGIKGYLYHWIGHLRAQAGAEFAVAAFPRVPPWGSLRHDASVLGAGATAWRIAALHAANHGGQAVMSLVAGPCDLFHATNQVAHGPRGARLTATIHDLTCRLFPQFHTAANVEADRRFAERILKRADGVIAVSEHTRQDAIRLLDLPPGRVETIPSGVSEAYFHVPEKKTWAAAERYELKKPYVLFVGTIEPRKNVDRLLQAWEALRAGIAGAFDLVVIGPTGWGSEQTLARLKAGRPGVRYLGYVPEDDLPALTAGATVFAYPSLYEGFGFPVAQALAAGVPVLTSGVSALPETAGDAAVLIDPESDHELRNGLLRLLRSESLREELRHKARRRAAAFHWEECARRSLEFFRRVLSR